jgi:prepilin-type N-terminal cleavage/methylation domain-containing protein
MTRASHAPKRGFTTLEMLIAMGVLGVILTVAAALLQSNQRATDVQQARTNSLEDARLAASRLIETVNQAAYIFPAGQRIQVNGLTGRALANEVTTGANALALLVPDGLNAAQRQYHGVVFYLADRTKFLKDLPNLPSNRIAPWVLVEARTGLEGIGAITWDRDALPPRKWATTINEGVLVDGMVEDGSTTTSDLMRSASFAPSAGIDQTVFSGGLRGNNPAITNANALLLGVSFQLSIRVSPVGQPATTTPSALIPGLGTARNVPRR